MAAGLASRLGLIVVILESAPCISFVLFQYAVGAGGKTASERESTEGETGSRRKRETEVVEEPRHNEDPNVAKPACVSATVSAGFYKK